MNLIDQIEKPMTFHHKGYVVESIDSSVNRFISSLCLAWDERIFADALQGARVTFLRHLGNAYNPMIELVWPLQENSSVRSFLKKGGGLHHICYEVDSLEVIWSTVRPKGDLIVRQPLPAIAFDGREIAWLYTRSKLLVEYLQE
jgi:methylmalonyl-CoA/ethylmalonyl-CoA epimerase